LEKLPSKTIWSLCKRLEQQIQYSFLRSWFCKFLSLQNDMIFYCSGWGYIVSFINVLIIYQTYFIWIHSLHQSPLLPSPHYWNSFNRYHFSIYIHVYTVFAPCSPFHTFLPLLPLVTGTKLPSKNMFCPSILWFCKRKRNDIFVCLR
jgi:hypothetical protein